MKKKTSSAETLLGFDACQSVLDSLWTNERIQLYLLKMDTSPLSVDNHVWPSVLEYKPLRKGMLICRAGWSELSKMNERLESVINRPYSKIAISVILFDTRDQPAWDRFLTKTNPSQPEKGWTFLGYDIADQGFISGLSNCGYSHGVVALRRKWSRFLNEHHLFDNLSSANEFRIFTNRRVKEHAPFFVFGIWRIP